MSVITSWTTHSCHSTIYIFIPLHHRQLKMLYIARISNEQKWSAATRLLVSIILVIASLSLLMHLYSLIQILFLLQAFLPRKWNMAFKINLLLLKHHSPEKAHLMLAVLHSNYNSWITTHNWTKNIKLTFFSGPSQVVWHFLKCLFRASVVLYPFGVGHVESEQ